MDYHKLRIILEKMYRDGSYECFISYFTTKKDECLKATIDLAGKLTNDDIIRVNERLTVYKELENIAKDVEEEIKLSESKLKKIERIVFGGKAA